MIDKDENRTIPFLVEKVTKGVRKQIKGYVSNIQEQIEFKIRSLEYTINDFKRLIDKSEDMRKDWIAVEMMLKEHEQNKKLMYQFRTMNEELRDTLLDIRLSQVELNQKIKMIRGDK